MNLIIENIISARVFDILGFRMKMYAELAQN
jgi:hypothetical protein